MLSRADDTHNLGLRIRITSYQALKDKKVILTTEKNQEEGAVEFDS